MEQWHAKVILRVTASFGGEERCVVWRNSRLVGDEEWIARAESFDPDVALRPPRDVVRALEDAAGTPVSLLIADQTADDALARGQS